MKTFSVLIAHYNNFEYFKDCYKSLLLQTYKDFEVVLVNDCSTNDSFEKIKEERQKVENFRCILIT